jgi:hypothetical protein
MRRKPFLWLPWLLRTLLVVIPQQSGGICCCLCLTPRTNQETVISTEAVRAFANGAAEKSAFPLHCSKHQKNLFKTPSKHQQIRMSSPKTT